jgi:transcriptional regulator with XRE-family HTH domain
MHKKQIDDPQTERGMREFGDIICTRRHEFRFSQRHLANLIKVSGAYVSRLEAGQGHPSPRLVMKIAEELLLDQRKLIALVSPRIAKMLGPDEDQEVRSAWETFRNDTQLRRLYKITFQELDLLRQISTMGSISRSADFIYILTSVRNALSLT